MFDSTDDIDINFDVDSSFTPIFSSTQGLPNLKRQNESKDEQVPKKIKLDHSLETKTGPFIKKNSFEANTTSINFYSPIKVVKRFFPGPAGLLANHFKNIENIGTNDTEQMDFPVCSQKTVSTFSKGPWKKMQDDFYTNNSEQLFEKFTIAWIKKTHNKQSSRVNAPFIAAVINSLEIDEDESKTSSVNISLKDKTGTIDALIIQEFYQNYSKFLTVGSVIVLSQVAVLTRSDSPCLTINKNNLILIYHLNNQDDSVNSIQLKDYRIEDIWKTANSVDTEIIKSKSPNVIVVQNSLTTVSVKNSAKSKTFSFEENLQYENISETTKTENENDLLKTMLEDIDTDLLFDEF